MKVSTKSTPLASVSAYCLLLALIWAPLPVDAAELHAHEEEEEVPRGPHAGRLLSAGDFTVELAIFEDGVPPEFRAWAYQDGGQRALPPGEWELEVELERLGGEVDSFRFEADPAGYLRGLGLVGEPHSFDVRVNALHQGRRYRWEYESHEGRVHLSPAMARANGVEATRAESGVLRQTVRLYGRVVPDPQRISHLRARFPGLIQEIGPALGDRVETGETVARIEANNSLQVYDIIAPLEGRVVDKRANPGEMAGEEPLLTIADYSRVWVDLQVFPGQASLILPEQAVRITMGERGAESRVAYLNPSEGGAPSITARVPLDNPDLRWTPGLLVEGEVTVGEIPVDLMVENRAIQTFRDWQVVFVKVGDEYEIRPLTLGRRDGTHTEVLEGLNPGDIYVNGNSYLLKMDLEKAGASHEH